MPSSTASVTAAVRNRPSYGESAETLTLYQMLILIVIFSAFLTFGFVMPTAGDAALMVANGAANALGQYLWTRSLHLAPASSVSPFFYFSLVWAIVIGFVVWGDVPTVGLLIGSAIVACSGLFLLLHESGARNAERRRAKLMD
jgi:drug/metabolite transporter (DMT)-like permease